MVNKALFNKDMTFSDALKKHKDTNKVFKKYGLQCTECMGNTQESLAMGAINHGLDPAEFLKELNKLK